MNEDKAARYHRLKRHAGILAGLTTALVLGAFLLTGASASLAAAANSIAPFPWLSVAIYVTVLTAAQAMVGFPLALYRTFLLDRRYGLSREPFSGWLGSHLKGSILGLVFAVLGAEVVYWLLPRSPDWWWLLSAAVFVAAMGLLTRLAPVLVMPIFYKFRPLDRESLRARLVALSDRAGVPVLGVYEWALGEKTRRANAALVGAGRTRRIIVSDTLLGEYSEDEIEVVMAHELGHHVHRHIRAALVADSALIVVALLASAGALNASWRTLGLAAPWDLAGLPVLLLTGGVVMLAASPLLNALSRRNERRADQYALEMTGQPVAFISAMKRLAAQNLAEEDPARAVTWLFHTHPPVSQRIEAARRFVTSRES